MKLPAVYLTPHIAPARGAVGRYDPKSDRIFFSTEIYFGLDDDTKRYAILHEIAHWFREKNIRKSLLAKGWSLSENGIEEDFADMFALFFINRKSCKSEYPAHHDFLSSHIDAITFVKVSDFSLEVFEKLQEKGECKEVRCFVV
jgi:hypothetical protein